MAVSVACLDVDPQAGHFAAGSAVDSALLNLGAAGDVPAGESVDCRGLVVAGPAAAVAAAEQVASGWRAFVAAVIAAPGQGSAGGTAGVDAVGAVPVVAAAVPYSSGEDW